MHLTQCWLRLAEPLKSVIGWKQLEYLYRIATELIDEMYSYQCACRDSGRDL